MVDDTILHGVVINSLPYSRLRCPSATCGGPAPLPLRNKRGKFKAMSNRFARIVVDPYRDLHPYPLAKRTNTGMAILFGGSAGTPDDSVSNLQEDLQLILGLTTSGQLGNFLFLSEISTFFFLSENYTFVIFFPIRNFYNL